MAQRTALVLETNPVITERYLNYTHDSQWRIMLKDTLNGFLEKLQQESFNLIIAEESLVPLGIINMLKSTGVPLLLSTNTKNAETATLPRNFNRTELLTVLDRLVPPDSVEEETPPEPQKHEDDAVNELLSGLEDEDDFFELSSDSVVPEDKQAQDTENIKETITPKNSDNFFGDDEFLSDSTEQVSDTTPSPSGNNANKEKKKAKDSLFAPPPLSIFNEKDDEIDNLVNSLSVDLKSQKPEESSPAAESGETTVKQDTLQPNDDFDTLLFNDESTPQEFSMDEEEPEKREITEVTPIPAGNEEKEDTTARKTPVEPPKQELPGDNSEIIKAEIRDWLDKNARSMIKEIVLEQLASLSGKHND